MSDGCFVCPHLVPLLCPVPGEIFIKTPRLVRITSEICGWRNTQNIRLHGVWMVQCRQRSAEPIMGFNVGIRETHAPPTLWYHCGMLCTTHVVCACLGVNKRQHEFKHVHHWFYAV